MIENIEQSKKKEIAILKILSMSTQPLGRRSLTRSLNGQGISLGERAVGYHLKIMDECGFTVLAGRTSGRIITRKGMEEINDGRVADRLAYMTTKVEALAYQTKLNFSTCKGNVPVDLVIIYKYDLDNAINLLRTISNTGFLLNKLIYVIEEKQKISSITIPDGMVGIATVSNVTIIGALLNAGIFSDLLFSGILQIKKSGPFRFTQLISHPGCTMHPGELFITGKMSSVTDAVLSGNGKILADFFHFPALCQDIVKKLFNRLIEIGFNKPLKVGEAGEQICEIPVNSNKSGIILQSGLNYAAALSEEDIIVTCYGTSGMLDISKMYNINDLS